eukprot:6196379-Pleurochrysis_carterae.AAC.2
MRLQAALLQRGEEEMRLGRPSASFSFVLLPLAPRLPPHIARRPRAGGAGCLQSATRPTSLRAVVRCRTLGAGTSRTYATLGAGTLRTYAIYTTRKSVRIWYLRMAWRRWGDACRLAVWPLVYATASQQQLVVLVGIPGSGKSTFSQQILHSAPSWVRVNQDTLGTRKRCMALAKAELLKGSNVRARTH